MTAVILSLAVTAMAPQIVNNIEASAGKRETNRLVSWAHWAQSNAITEQRHYRIVFDDPSNKYTVQKFNGVAFVDIATVVLKEGINLRFVTFPSSTLEFDEFGAPVPTGGSAQILNKEWYVETFSVNNVTGTMTLI